jgi:hypothetical protein
MTSACAIADQAAGQSRPAAQLTRAKCGYKQGSHNVKGTLYGAG